jgi:hypothetical protein
VLLLGPTPFRRDCTLPMGTDQRSRRHSHIEAVRHLLVDGRGVLMKPPTDSRDIVN